MRFTTSGETEIVMTVESAEDWISVSVYYDKQSTAERETLLDSVTVTDNYENEVVYRVPADALTDMAKSITYGYPYSLKAEGLTAFRDYTVHISYRVLFSGKPLPERHTLACSVMTAVSHDGMEPDYGQVSGTLAVKEITTFPGGGMCGVNCKVDLTFYTGGSYTVTAVIAGRNASVTREKEDMQFSCTKEVDELGNTYRTGYFLFTVFASDVGYGAFDVTVTVIYEPLAGGRYESSAESCSYIDFKFFYLYADGYFRITAYEWNVFTELLRLELIRRGGEPGTVEEVNAGDEFGAGHITAAVGYFGELSGIYGADIGEMEAYVRRPPFGFMGFGKCPLGGVGAYELFSAMEQSLNGLMS